MKKSKKIDRNAAVLGVNALPRVAAPQGGRQTFRAFQEQERQREQEEQRRRQEAIDRPVREAQEQIAATLREIRATQSEAVKTFWSQDLASIGTQGIEARGAFFDLTLPTGTQEQADVVATFNNFIKPLNLSDEQVRKFGSFVTVQKHRGVIVDENSIAQMWDALADLDVMPVRAMPQVARVEEVEQPKDFISEIEHMDTSTREGRERAKALATEAHLTGPVRETFYAWKQHLYNDYGFSPTDAQSEFVVNFIQSTGRDYLDKRSWDAARLHCVRIGLFPQNLKTPAERLADSIETQDMSQWHARQNFKAALATIR
jgi:hypothetical protein